MKKLLLMGLLLIGSGMVTAQNYKESLGLRLGTSIGASYKSYLSDSKAIEAILDLDIFEKDLMKINVTAGGFFFGVKHFH